MNTLKLSSQFIHPLIMLLLFGYFIYIAYLGWQIRRTRSTSDELKKQLIQKRYNIRHHQLGAIALSVMIIGSLGGMASTYLSYGELTVDAHLLVGLGMTGAIAIAASLTPYMQKGHIWAKNTHIAINISLLTFFGWQTVTGFGIILQILNPA
jgi:Protein of unknown function (DUF4079)